jgi:ribose transport system permease protein
MLFEAFAAVVIGGVSLRGGVGRLSGVFAGMRCSPRSTLRST